MEKLLDKRIVLSKYVTGVWGVEGLGEGEGATLSVSELKKGKLNRKFASVILRHEN